MNPPIRKATFILRLWTDDDPGDDQTWHGTADQIGRGLPYQFRTIDEFIVWLRQELTEIEETQK